MSNGEEIPELKFKLLPSAETAVAPAQELPLVSIIMFVRDRAEAVRRAIDSVLSQDYPHIHFVIQDAVSTDGTLEILKSYGDRIDLVSERDTGVHDGFWRALQRVKGEIIGQVASDEQLMPGAIRRGVQELLAAPEAGAITGDAYMSEYSGHVFSTWTGQDFDFLAYLLGDYCPHFSATFFRTSALKNVGMFDSPWREGRKEPVEFEIWCRLGTQHIIKYVHHTFYKFGHDQSQLSQSIPRITEELDRRTAVMDSYLFGANRFFGDSPELRAFILRRQHEIIVNHLNCNADPEGALKIEARMYEVLGLEIPKNLKALVSPRVRMRNLSAKIIKQVSNLVGRENIVTRLIRRFISDAHLNGVRQRSKNFYYRLRGIPNDFLLVNPLGLVPQAPIPDEFRGRMYVYTAQRFRDRGMVAQALQMYEQARELGDPEVDQSACQLALASPDLTDEDLERMHRRWSEKYFAPDYHIVQKSFRDRERAGDGRITIGYHCIFWGSFCADALALSVFAHHDPERFRIVGYSPFVETGFVQRHFDVFHGATQDYDDRTFADMVRADGVDIFVELSGLSHFHRYGAMALRAAPIQANYVNHLGTTQIANVDYIIGDEITFPVESDMYCSEEIWRLPDCFLAYHYEDMEMPELAPPPSMEKPYITFGSFGGPFKLNRECLDLWAAVLCAVPNSRFLMQNPGMNNGSNADYIVQKFRERGVDPERITVLGGTDRDSNLKNYGLMDISLDSWPYCGGNSLAEALWQGVPVVTLTGIRATAAYGASLVTAAGLSDLVARSPSEFVSIAAQLAADTDRLKSLRYDLRGMMRANGLSDPGRVARSLEGAYEAMMTRRFGPPGESLDLFAPTAPTIPAAARA
jgi:glycosyltransferase involved in cell wall biosynthesis